MWNTTIIIKSVNCMALQSDNLDCAEGILGISLSLDRKKESKR
jgi:hypothetical protein